MDRRWMIAGALGLLLGAGAGWFAADSGTTGVADRSAAGGEQAPLYWVAPMDSSYRRDGPGKSPMGMDLIPVYEDDSTDLPGVRVSPTLAHNFGVRLASVTQAPLDLSIDTLGKVALAEPAIEHVHPRVSGWIERLVADTPGDPVRAGQVLLELYSPELVRGQEEFLVAQASGEEGLLEASRARLQALGVSAEQLADLAESGRARPRIALRAGRDGFLLSLGVREGMYVEPRTEVMAIGALDPVWVMAEVFERDVPGVEVGQRAELTLDYLPGERWTGEVDYVYPRLDPVARTLRVRLVLPNPEGLLRPGMFGNVRLFAAETAPTLQIPAEALIHGVGDAPDRVVVALADDRYGSRAVRVGRRTADRVEILAGLREGERVVASGQFLIDSESDVDTDLLRMGPAPTQPSGLDRPEDDHSEMDHAQRDHSGTQAAETEQVGEPGAELPQ